MGVNSWNRWVFLWVVASLGVRHLLALLISLDTWTCAGGHKAVLIREPPVYGSFPNFNHLRLATRFETGQAVLTQEPPLYGPFPNFDHLRLETQLETGQAVLTQEPPVYGSIPNFYLLRLATQFGDGFTYSWLEIQA